jgi:hypothetical protein
MSEQGSLQFCDEALHFIARIENPVTRSLVNMAFVHIVKRVHLQKSAAPRSDVDMLFLVTALAEYFSEHSVIARTLEGELVGAWDDGAD